MKKNIVIVILSICLFISCDLFTENKATESNSAFSNAVLTEINFARTKPKEYAQTRLQAYKDTNSDNGAYAELMSKTPLNALSIQPELNQSSQKYAEYLATNNVFGHNEKGTPESRVKAEGYLNYSGENIAAGGYDVYNASLDPKRAAEQFVLLWIIDEGISGVGHRVNIFNTIHKKMGIGFFHKDSSTYKNYAVQAFGSK